MERSTEICVSGLNDASSHHGGWTVSGVYIPFEMVSAGLHWSLRMSRQIEPLLLMLGW